MGRPSWRNSLVLYKPQQRFLFNIWPSLLVPLMGLGEGELIMWGIPKHRCKVQSMSSCILMGLEPPLCWGDDPEKTVLERKRQEM